MVDENKHKELVFEANRKSKLVAYLLWFFLGWFGVHRFYAGYAKSGVIQLLLTLSIIGIPVMLFWLFLDIFLIPGLVNDKNMELINTLNYGDPRGAVRPDQIAQPQDEREPVLDSKRQAMLDDLRTTGYRKERRDPTRMYR